MTERFLILGVLFLLSVSAFSTWRWFAAYRFRRAVSETLPTAVVHDLAPVGPTVLYFTTPECSQCRFRQTPILEQLSQGLGVSVLPIDAASRPEIADFFGVMTVPSTVLIDEQRRPMAINHGLVTLAHLEQQLVGRPMAT